MKQVLAEMVSKSGVLWETARLSDGSVLAGLLFLVLICMGIALDFALGVYCLKRPSRPADWTRALTERALPGRIVLLLAVLFGGLYVTVSLGHTLFFDLAVMEPEMLLFQALFFHLPALVILAGVFRALKMSGSERLGLRRSRVSRWLGLAVLLYLAALPPLWFYGLLYQIFLDQLGHPFQLQEVTQIFLMPMSRTVRAGVIFTAVIGAPVFEEIVFRGILFPWTVRRAGLWPAVGLVSILFALMHLHLPSLLPLFLLSSMFCVAYARTKSLWVPIGMHACFNGVSILLLMLMG